MPLYRFHIFNDDHTQDLQGRLFPNAAAAHSDAIKSARSIMAEELAGKGEITLSHRIEVEDEQGEVTVVTFGEAVKVNP